MDPVPLIMGVRVTVLLGMMQLTSTCLAPPVVMPQVLCVWSAAPGWTWMVFRPPSGPLMVALVGLGALVRLRSQSH